jgi:hypothetical protein
MKDGKRGENLEGFKKRKIAEVTVQNSVRRE